MKCLGIFGSPEALWEKSLAIGDIGGNAVFVGAGELSDELIEKCHDQSARVFSEISVFANYSLTEEYPELWPVDEKGEKVTPPSEGYLGMCPSQEWYRNDLLKKIADYISRYEVDGLWLDFIRYHTRWEVPIPKLQNTCFCPTCLAKFSEGNDMELPGNTIAEKARYILTEHSATWVDWKCRQITDFVAEIKDTLRNSREDAILGIFAVPWREEDFDDAIHKIIAQDFVALAPYVDVFSPMVYHGLCGKHTDWIGEITTYMKEKTNKEVWPIVQAMDEPEEMRPGELKEALQIGLEASSTGVMFFTIDHIVASERKLEEVREAYKGG